MKNPVVLSVIGLLVAGGAFYGGMQYQISVQTKAEVARQAARGDRGGFGVRGQGGTGRQGGFSAPTAGKVLSKDDTSMTVELTAGGSKIVILSGETKALHTTDIGLAAVRVGDTVTVMGSANADGSVTASRIETGVVRQFGGGNTSATPPRL